MKRITLLLLSFITVVATVTAQNRMSGGISLGANYSKLSTDDDANYDWKWKWGPVGGIYLNFPIGNTISIMPSLLYSKMGTKYDYTDPLTNTTTKWTQDLGYLSIPVALKINAGNSLGFLVGPQFDFLVGAHSKDQNDNKTKNEDNFKQSDIALTGGLVIMPNSPVSFTVRYIHGLSDIREASSNTQTFTGAFHNRSIQGTLNFRLFGGEKKAVAITTPSVPVETTPPVDLCTIDTDKDGVMDCNDKCVSVAGVAKYNGCPVPDSDNDGINDDNDKCPTVPGVERYQGCPIPDSDNDGVNDEEDNCPHLAGPASNHGCPLVDQSTQSKVDMMTKNIAWTTTRSYTLSTKSNKSLDQIASMLTADPNMKVTVATHTDNVGSDADNKTLSQSRADAVKAYLVSKGVNESQITATGYGEEQPIADNNTAAGRAKNNRIEIKLSY